MTTRILIGIFVAGAACAQPPGMGREGGREGGMFRFSPVLSALDADKDGGLSAGEIAGAPKALRSLDKNGDGTITADEMRPAMGPGGPGGRGGGAGESTPNISAEMVATLMEFDRDGDGKLSKAEVPERFQGLFARCDADQDGFLTKDELTKAATATAAPSAGPGREGGRGGGREGMRGGPMRDPVTAALDADGDGTLSAAEIDNAPAALRKLDKNADGRITEDEIRPSFGPGREGFSRERRQ